MTMSNSAMVNYIKMSPNFTKMTNKKNVGIIIHHMAGNLSVQTCGELFAKTSRQASSNYGVNHKDVGLYVDESQRAWTTGSREVDSQAVTIEVANNGGAPDWPIADDTLDTLIKLCIDICKRNGIPKLVWIDDKESRKHFKNGANICYHSDVQATTCPGPTLKKLIVEKIIPTVNERLFNSNNEPDDSRIRYNVQIGSYKLKANAEAQLQKAKNAGFTDAFIKEINI